MALIPLATPVLAGPAGDGVVHRIPPGREDAIQKLLEPLALGEEITGGFRLEDIRLEAEEIVLVVQRGSGDALHEALIRLVHPARPTAPEVRALDAGAFVVWTDAGAPPAVVERIVAALRSDDPKDFWRTDSKAPEGAEETARQVHGPDQTPWESPVGTGTLLVCLSTFLGLLWFNAQRARRVRRDSAA